MATRTRKTKTKEVVDKDRGFMAALQELGKEKGIASETLFEAIERALVAAYKKNYNNAPNSSVSLDRQTGEYHVYAIKTVVDEVLDPVQEISLAMARQISPNYELGDTLQVEVTPANFSRIAAQNAKQVVVQAIREAERGIIMDEYTNRTNDIITGTVQHVENRNVYINLGKTEAVLTPTEQIAGEIYRVNDRVKALIVTVEKNQKGQPRVSVSRTHPGLLRRLFELEVPEIQNGIVEIKSVSREPGMRSKIAVYANDESVDAIGSCVGQRGFRVQSVVDELCNEKIDVVKWSEDPAEYIANALSPASVISVTVSETEKKSRVIVPDNQLSLAIGKEGQNARLAAKLTGWKIDIKSASQAEEEGLYDPNDQYDGQEYISELQDEFYQDDNQEADDVDQDKYDQDAASIEE